MLYDIMPPTIFFLSLGGALIMLSRVIIRIRRQEFSVATKAGVNAAAGKTQSHSDVSKILKPTQKSVQAAGTRFTQAAAVIKKLIESAKIALLAIVSKLKRIPFREISKKKISVVKNRVNTAVKLSEKKLAVTKERISSIRKQKKKTPNIELFESKLKGKAIKTRIVTTPSEENLVVAKKIEEPSKKTILPRLRSKQRQEDIVTQKASQAISEKQFDQAEDILIPYIMKHAKDTSAYMLLGQVAIGKESWTEAIEIFEQVAIWKPEQEGLNAKLGYAACRAGQYTKALQVLQRANEEDPNDMNVLQDLLGIARKMDNRGLQDSISAKIKQLKKTDSVKV